MTLAQAQTLNEALFPDDAKRRGEAAGDLEIKSEAHFQALLEAARQEVEITSQSQFDALAREWAAGKAAQ